MRASELIQKLVEIVGNYHDMEVVISDENLEIKEVTTDGFRHGSAIQITPVWPEEHGE